LDSQAEATQEPQFFAQKPLLLLLIVGFLFIAAFGIRLCHIDEPPLDFNPTRQYRSAIIARGLYFESVESIPEWRKEVASINKQRTAVLEPPIMEYIASLAYRIVGGEYLWIPRVLSSIFWLIGGAFLFAIARKIVSTDAAVFSTAFFLFLLFGVEASRSFQPDPMMVMMLLISIFTIFRYHDNPSTLRLLLAATVSALAMFIKPVCMFPIFGAFLSLAIYRRGLMRSVVSLNFLTFAVVSLLPAFIYNFYGLFIAGFLKGQVQGSFLPHLLLNWFFWKSWLVKIGMVVGFPALILALLGVPMFHERLPRALMIGLWSGYFVFGLVFNYHIHTHDYYQLQFIPIVALSLGPVCAVVVNRLTQVCVQWYWRVAVWGILVVALILNIGYAEGKLASPDSERQVRVAQEIGESVNHSTKTVFLSHAYGKPLKYYGELCGLNWPASGDFRSDKLRGLPELDAEERFNTKYLTHSPEYFIVTQFQEFEKQPDLRNFLTSKFPIIAQSDDYLIFNLTERLDLNK
jgi:hypothetical protein